MKLVNFLYLFMVVSTLVWADGPIEIVSGGTTYSSMENYQAARLAAFFDKRKAQQKHSIKADKKITVPVPPAAPISDQTARQWHLIGYEDGLKRVQIDFRQNWDNPVARFVISTEELEGRLAALADGRKEPLLFMSDANKLRVMVLGKDTGKDKNVP